MQCKTRWQARPDGQAADTRRRRAGARILGALQCVYRMGTHSCTEGVKDNAELGGLEDGWGGMHLAGSLDSLLQLEAC